MHDRISSFPEGWEQALLGDIVQILDHHRVPVNADERALRVGVYPYYGANGQAGTIDSFLFDGDFALLAEDGGNFDDSTKGVAYRVMGKFWVNNHAHILAPQGGMSTQFLVYALNALNWMPHVSGTTRLKLTQGSLKKVPLSIPPLPEQRRIVAKIEALQERSRKARAALEAIPPLLEQFRQSVLAAAFRGDLTADWRAQHPDVEPASVLLDRIRAERRRRWEEAELAKMQAKGKMPKDEKWKERYKELEAVDETELPELPELPGEWEWVSMGDITDSVLGRMLDRSKHTSGIELPYLRNINIRWGNIDTSDLLTMYFEEDNLERYMVQEGDVLVCEGGEPGRAAVWTERDQQVMFQKALHRMRPLGGILPLWFVFHLWLDAQSGMLEPHFTGTTIKHFTGVALARYLTRLAPVAEQREIVRRIQNALNSIETIRLDVSESLEKLDRFDHSILAKAFRGELVPQDPNDEPASVLLERIRAEREAQSAKPRAKKKTPGSTKHTKKAPPVSVNENDDLPLFNSLQK